MFHHTIQSEQEINLKRNLLLKANRANLPAKIKTYKEGDRMLRLREKLLNAKHSNLG